MMTTLFLYSLKSAFALVLLYVPYALLMHREKSLRRNRLTLIGILVLSLVLPLCNVSRWSMDRQPLVQEAQRQMIEAGIPIHTALGEMQNIESQAETETDIPSQSDLLDNANTTEMAETLPAADPTEPTSHYDWFLLLSILFAIGMTLVLGVRLWQFCHMGAVIRRGSLWQDQVDGIHIYCHSEQVAPFSWLNNIVINDQDYAQHGQAIILHEQGHIHHRHSLDIVLLTLVQMLQWWNPAIYLLARHLRDVQEYEADDYVLRHGIDPQYYQILLLQSAAHLSSIPLVNSFNHSLIKNRIKMMSHPEPKAWMRSKMLYIIPLSMFALSVFATPSIIEPIESTVNQLAEQEEQQTVQPMENDTTLAKKERFVIYARWKCPGGWMSKIYVNMPRGTWVEDHINNKSYRDELGMDPVWFKPDSPNVFHNLADTVVVKIDGVVYDRKSVPSRHWSVVKKVEYYPNPMTVNVITKDVAVPSDLKDNVPRVQSIVLRNDKWRYILDEKWKEGDWSYHPTLSWKNDITLDNAYFYFHYTQRKPDLKVYIFASTDVTQKGIDRAVNFLNELGIKNYEIIKDIPIYHWTDEQYRAWAEKQKALGVKYSVSALKAKLIEEYVDVSEMEDMRRWNRVVRPVFKSK